MASKMRLRVATPDSEKFNDDVEMVIMRCISGDMGILPYHEATSAVLDCGVLRILNDYSERRMAVFGGIVQVRNNTVTLIANDAQWPEEIDVALVESERERLAGRAKENLDGLDEQKDKIMIRRNLVQKEVSEYSGTSKTKRES